MTDVLIKALKPASSTRVDGVLVRVYDSNGVFVTQGTTGEGANQPGERLFDLSAGDYTMRLSMSEEGYSVVSPQSFTVSGVPASDSFIVRVSQFELPESQDSRFCRCSGFFLSPDASPAAAATIRFALQTAPLLVLKSGIIQRKAAVKLDDNGYGQVDLIRGALYRAECEGLLDIEHEIQVPDAPSASLPDVVYPFVDSVEFTPASLSLTAGGSESVTLLVRYRSGLELDLDDVEASVVSFETSDPSVTVSRTSSIIVSATQSGSFTVTAKRVDQSNVASVNVYPVASSTLGSLAVTVT